MTEQEKKNPCEELTDDELDQVTGGDHFTEEVGPCPESSSGKHDWEGMKGIYRCRLCKRLYGGRIDGQGIS